MPLEWPFWTGLRLPRGEELICLDRGSDIVTGPDGVVWVDPLVAAPPVPFGRVVTAHVVWP